MNDINVSIIGLGSMGSMICKRLIDSNCLSQNQLFISNRTRDKTLSFQAFYPNVNIVSNENATKYSDIILLCVKPKDFIGVLNLIKPYLTLPKHLVSISGLIPFNILESYYKGPISIAIPTITGEIGKGISLLVHNNKVTSKSKMNIENIFSSMGRTKEINIKHLDVLIELTSCTPGFIGSIFENYINAIGKHIDIDRGQIEQILLETVKGSLDWLYENKMTFIDLINRVATKGGITEEGVNVLNRHLPKIYDVLFQKTLEKRKRMKDACCPK